MGLKTLKNKFSINTPIRLLAVSTACVFVAEGFIMILLPFFPPMGLWIKVLLDASLIAVFVIPVLYLWFFRPLNRLVHEQSLTAKSLRNSEHKLLEAQSIAKLGHYIFDVQTNCWTNSAQLDEIFGIDKDYQRDADGLLRIIHPEYAEAMTNYLQNDILSEHRRFDKEYKIINVKTGQSKWVHGLGDLRLDDNGNPIELFGTIQDITESKQIERNLLASKSKLIKAQHIARMGFLEWDLRTNNILLSDEAVNLFGLDPNTKTISSDLLLQHVHNEDIDFVRDRLKLAVTGESAYNIDHRIIRTDGKVVWVQSQSDLVFDDDGNPSKLLGTMIDITERKLSEEMLRRYETIVSNSNDMLALLDNNFVYLAVNDTYVEAFGKTHSEVVGHSVSEVFGETFFETVIRPKAEQCLLGNSVNYCNEMDFPVFGKRKMEVTYNPFLSPDNEIIGFVVNGRDITDRRLAEESLKASSQRLQLHFEQTPLAVIEWNVYFEVTDWNPAAEAIFGFKKEEVIGRHASLIVPNSVKEQVDEVWQSLLTIEGGSRSTNENITQAGKLILCEWYNTPLIDTEGKVVGVASLVMDVTKSKQSEESLRESEERFKKLFFEAPVSYQSLDGNGCLLEVNETWCGTLGYKREEVIGHNIAEFIDPECIDVFGQCFPKFKEIGSIDGLEFTLIKKDGSRIIASFKGRIGLNDDRSFKQTHCIFTDVTEQKRVEESNARLSRAIEQADETIVITDAKGTIQYVNPAFEKMTGYTANESVGKNPRILQSGQHDDAFYKRMWATLSSGKQWHGELVNKKKDGTFITENAVISPVFDQTGEIINYVAAKNDITEIKRLQELESRAVRLEMAGTIAGQVAHDFNNLLAPIIAYPEFIHEGLPDDHEAHKYLDVIEDAANKIAEINQDLLTMGRRGHYNHEVVDLNKIVLRVVREMESVAKGVSYELNLCDDIMRIEGGDAQISRMIINLLVNARDAIQSSGQVNIRTENYYADEASSSFGRVPKGEYVKLTITDNGHGIPEEIIGKILDPFFSTKTTDKMRGSGLGMSVVDAVIKDHNGFLDLKSEVGRGTSFYLYFPITREDVKEEESEGFVCGTEKILIVDDDDIQREVSTYLLTKLGYEVNSVESGERAIDFLRRNQQDLVILDMVMPGGIDGPETYRRILEICPGQKAIVLSGFAESEKVLEVQKLGAGAFVKKPMTRKIIASAVRAELDRQVEVLSL